MFLSNENLFMKLVNIAQLSEHNGHMMQLYIPMSVEITCLCKVVHYRLATTGPNKVQQLSHPYFSCSRAMYLARSTGNMTEVLLTPLV